MIDFEKDVPKVAIDFMNQDHQHATDITNRLLQLVAQASPDNNTITQTLSELYSHAEVHFAREEEQMRRINFPPYPIHHGEHQRVLEEMQAIMTCWQQQFDLEQLRHYVQQTLPEWFIQHINTMDSITAEFIAQFDAINR